MRRLLEADSGGWNVCGEASDGADALEKVANLLPDILLLDLSIPVVDGLTVAKSVRKDYPAARVVLVSEQDESILAQLAETAGTPHYISKSRLAAELIPLLLSLEKK